MPYVITTKPRCPSCRTGDGGGECLCADAESRRAVATLGDAQAYVSGLIQGIMPWPSQPEATAVAARQLFTLPESGGTIGPLPDGTVIEVKRLEWIALARIIGADCGDLCACPNAAIIDAYNAREV